MRIINTLPIKLCHEKYVAYKFIDRSTGKETVKENDTADFLIIPIVVDG